MLAPEHDSAVLLITIAAVLFTIKHYLCDFQFQTPYMLGKMNKTNWVAPLAAHCGAHALGTLLTIAILMVCIVPLSKPLYFVAYYKVTFGKVLLLISAEFAIHFVMDRIKASPNLWGRWGPTDREFWLALGVDQAVHTLTYIFMAYVWYAIAFG